MVKTLILPGLNGSGETHWQRIWARDCPGSEIVEQENWNFRTFRLGNPLLSRNSQKQTTQHTWLRTASVVGWQQILPLHR